MANRLTHNEEVAGQTVDGYLTDLTRHLRRHLPPQETTEIIDETGEHLRAHVEDASCNIVDAEALRRIEQEAIAGFGHPAVFAHRAARGIYETSASNLARCIGGVTIGIVFLLGVAGALVDFQLFTNFALGLGLLAFVGIAFVLPICGFIARRSHLRLILSSGLLLLFSSVFMAGYYKTTLPNGQWADRRTITVNQNYTRRQIAETRSEIQLLEAGMVFWRYKHQPVRIGDLFQNGGYVVPVAPLWKSYDPHWKFAFQHCNAFRPTEKPVQETINTLGIQYKGTEYDTVVSVEEARNRWLRYAPLWLPVKREQIKAYQRELSGYQSVAESSPKRFAGNFVWWDDLWSVPFTAGLLAMDSLAVWLGRKLFLRRRRRRNSQRPTTA